MQAGVDSAFRARASTGQLGGYGKITIKNGANSQVKVNVAAETFSKDLVVGANGTRSFAIPFGQYEVSYTIVGVHRCSCGYPPSPRGGPALWETLKVATFAIPQSHSVDCKAERVRPGRCGNDTPIVPSASWRRSKTVTRNGRRTSPRRRGTSRLTAGTSGIRCCASKTPVGISRLYLCAARRHTPEL